MNVITEIARKLADEIETLPWSAKVDAINEARKVLHSVSPFKNEPVDCVLWVSTDLLEANDYNPNTVAPPEMELLRVSINEDGYTQPIVAWERETHFEVVDGFHRNRVGRECDEIRERIHGHLPVSIIQDDRQDRADRIASTIRHNRARGKHGVQPMADIVMELKRRNWSDKKIGKQLGMDADEVLRLSQITGLAEMFQDTQFSEAWESSNSVFVDDEGDIVDVEDDAIA